MLMSKHVCTRSFRLAYQCLHTSIRALLSADSSYHLSYYKFRIGAQILAYKHLGTVMCSLIVPIYHTARFWCASQSLCTSIWALLSVHSSSQSIILYALDWCQISCIQASVHFCSFSVVIYHTISFDLCSNACIQTCGDFFSAHSLSSSLML